MVSTVNIRHRSWFTLQFCHKSAHSAPNTPNIAPEAPTMTWVGTKIAETMVPKTPDKR